MGHVDERDPDLALDPLEFELHDVAQLEVECPQRFVEQQRARVVHQRAGQRDALLLAAGQLCGFAQREVGQSDHVEHLVDAPLDLGFVLALATRTVRDVVPHGHVREQRVMLEHRVDIALVRRHAGDVLALEADGAFGRGLETRDHPQRGGLAATRRTQHREEFTRCNGEIRVDDRDVILEPFGDMVDLDHRAALRGATLVLSGLLVCGLCADLGQDGSSRSVWINNHPSEGSPQPIPSRKFAKTMDSVGFDGWRRLTGQSTAADQMSSTCPDRARPAGCSSRSAWVTSKRPVVTR